MGEFSRQIIEVSRGLVKRAQAPEQAGLFAGLNPATYNPNDPFPLWVIQTIIIIAMSQFLALFLGRIRQPRVIAEVIGGVLLGPSVMGRIPGFTNAIFPKDSLPMLTLTSTIGLIFFLFLVGLEIDMRIVKRNAKASTAISVAGLVIPLGLGAALAIPLYHQFIDPSVNYGYFILFVAVAVGITAFPVLCRILTEVKLLETTVGVVVLSAGVGNDVVGWVLLALTVALVNASTGLTALWVLLTGAGFALFLLFPVRWAYVWLAKRSGSFETGQPSALMVTLTLIIILVSAFFTDIIGIHPIFGGFLAGLIIPKDNGFAISLVEKLEDFIGLLLLPQYFALSGLKTNLGLLDNGITWGYTILICVVAFFSKFLSCSIAAKSFGYNLRESGAIGALMSCKGLVELIVLNVGLSANILNTRTFSMFVLHALVLTFITTPLTLWIYPARVRTHAGAFVENRYINEKRAEDGDDQAGSSNAILKTKFAVVLDKIEQLPAAMTLTQLLQRPSKNIVPSTRTVSLAEKVSVEDTQMPSALSPTIASTPRAISIDALRLIELTERTSAVLKSQAAESLVHSDPVLSVFRTFGLLNKFSVSASLSVVSYDEFSANVADHARECGSDMVLIPWSSSTTFSEDSSSSSGVVANPFDTLFGKHSSQDQTSSIVYSQFIRRTFANTPTDVALFIDRGLTNSTSSEIHPHVFLPFFGGPDDRLALSFVVQLCTNDAITATVVRVKKVDSNDLSPMSTIEDIKGTHFPSLGHGQSLNFPDTVYGQHSTQTRLQSETADNIAWAQFTSHTTPHKAEVAHALSRVTFLEEQAVAPLHRVVDLAAQEASRESIRPLFIVTGRSRRLAAESHEVELRQLISEKRVSIGSDAAKTLGDVAAAFVATGANASLLVLQARN
ncbi:cation/H+ exchanger [Dentipellis sp. KUC8613]|nr:cation/H+ exchanger [Dentipellis sp. KUC8613]